MWRFVLCQEHDAISRVMSDALAPHLENTKIESNPKKLKQSRMTKLDFDQDCQIFLDTMYQSGKIYTQIYDKITKFPKNIPNGHNMYKPNGHKIYQHFPF
jgi:hypothetical protein